MVQDTGYEDHDEIRLRAREALRSYGPLASRIVAKEAETQFLVGNVLGAFYQRLIVRAIEQIEEESRKL
jgi:hypothetical protein